MTNQLAKDFIRVYEIQDEVKSLINADSSDLPRLLALAKEAEEIKQRTLEALKEIRSGR